jgi:hypothetical protein
MSKMNKALGRAVNFFFHYKSYSAKNLNYPQINNSKREYTVSPELSKKKAGQNGQPPHLTIKSTLIYISNIDSS